MYSVYCTFTADYCASVPVRHTDTHTHTHTHTHRSIKTAYPPVSLRSLGGYNNQTVNDGVAHSKNPKKCAYHVTVTLSTPWMHADLESIVCKFGGDPAIYLREAICAKVYRQTDGQTTDAAPLH